MKKLNEVSNKANQNLFNCAKALVVQTVNHIDFIAEKSTESASHLECIKTSLNVLHDTLDTMQNGCNYYEKYAKEQHDKLMLLYKFVESKDLLVEFHNYRKENEEKAFDF